MIEIESLGPRALAVTLAGLVSETDIERIEAAVAPLLEGEGPVGLAVDIAGVTDVTARALVEDLRHEVQILGKWGRFRRVAVVSDKAWVRTALELFGPLLPHSEVRVFGAVDRNAALAFAAELPDADPAPHPAPAVRLIETGDARLMAFEIDGTVSEADLETVFGPLAEALERGKLRLLVRLTRYGGFAPAMLMQGPLWSIKMSALANLERYAIVGAEPWMQTMIAMTGPLTPFDMLCFPATEEDAAWAWLREGLADAQA